MKARLADILQQHSSLGGICTCGTMLPKDRLDTPRWFAEHLAEVVLRDFFLPDNRGVIEAYLELRELRKGSQ